MNEDPELAGIDPQMLVAIDSADDAALVTGALGADGGSVLHVPIEGGHRLVVPTGLRAAVDAAIADLPVLRKGALRAHAAARRYALEVGGTTAALPGTPPRVIPVRTDRETRSALLEAWTAHELTEAIRAEEIAQDGTATTPAWETEWALADGSWTTVDGPMIRLIVGVVSAWRSAAFGLQKQVVDAIEAGTITTTAAIDAIFDAA